MMNGMKYTSKRFYRVGAKAFEKLLTIEYYFCLAYKGKGFEVRGMFVVLEELYYE